MKLASLQSSHSDGLLILVSKDMSQASLVTDIAPTLQYAINHWQQLETSLQARYELLNKGEDHNAFPFHPQQTTAPLPKTYQWLDGSAFLNHSDLMQKAFHLDPIVGADKTPLMYQGAGDDFLGGYDPIIAISEDHGIDFEGEVAVIVDDVPMGCGKQESLGHIKLIVQLNDISLRAFAPKEMKTGFGFIQAKPSTSFAPIAITPDELGDAWQDGRIHLPLQVTWNNQWFGHPNGREMSFGFHQLVSHAAKTRKLSAGSIIGSGTLSNADREAGSACISERRAIEMIANQGVPSTEFMKFGDRIQMDILDESGQSMFGGIDQFVQPYSPKN
ncbi:Fumarylacetoacetate (FAA) hydrolase family protein [Marinomonas spartinae]|uniref:Fumarylacetoacetate (FAA) hydrolase family protein n=1 Tax=Marinomonas spartinae TaxID=1792290 RepID=A0A1A8TTH1_9GAMM|nr:fumarylacetoacetate hydrolase family protein [Marinomonas spartinae]SBS29476.1 Fumarylacetoacetate (FAA) hydrolase family protein [Marinomonas spartinae]SBS37023.1 Fumarylacetoacetate (FAA) hydrolase family protein [Marinomonas spartinae]